MPSVRLYWRLLWLTYSYPTVDQISILSGLTYFDRAMIYKDDWYFGPLLEPRYWRKDVSLLRTKKAWLFQKRRVLEGDPWAAPGLAEGTMCQGRIEDIAVQSLDLGWSTVQIYKKLWFTKFQTYGFRFPFELFSTKFWDACSRWGVIKVQ